VFDNVDVGQTTRNAVLLLDVAGRPDVSIARGADRPLLRSPQSGGPVVPGDYGPGGAMLPAPPRA
jgi:inosine-uridine nucleoside N-ribohydrolase